MRISDQQCSDGGRLLVLTGYYYYYYYYCCCYDDYDLYEVLQLRLPSA